MSGRKKVAIVGGGLGGLTAAFQLTATPALRARHSVTVYQMGWRLGGKGASGRGAHGRVEEHGLHLFFGFYDNTFAMIRALYDEVGGQGCLPTWTDAFHPQDELTLFGGQPRQPWRIRFPRNPGLPGDGGGYPDLEEGLTRALAFGLAQLSELVGRTGGQTGTSGHLARIVARHGASMLKAAQGLEDPRRRAALLTALAGLRRRVGTALGPQLARGWVGYRLWVLLDWALTLVQGILRDDLLAAGAWRRLDGEDYRSWLTRHGASSLTVDSMLVRSYYAAVLASSDAAPLTVGAGTALHTQLRMFLTYRGSFLWKMTLGMGETVFTPMYRVLKDRGVSFRFFHRLVDVVPDGERVAALRFVTQATPRGTYAPLTRVCGLDAWPAAPDWGQLREGDALRGQDLDAYQPVSSGRRELRCGTDFDTAIFAIPVGAIPHAAPSLVRSSPRWRLAAERTRTIQTQSFQLWLRPTLAELGWEHAPPFGTCFAPPVDTWASMAPTLAHEDWPASRRPGGLLYFTGFLDGPAHAPVDDPAFTARQRAAAEASMRRYVRDHLSEAIPGLSRDDLYTPTPGADPMDAQFFKANTEPWDRYTLSAPRTNQYRIRPDDTGFDNLSVAGDWVDNGFYSACAEGATMSGMLAARAISGEPIAIAGEALW